ncbi:hypothetical protein [Dysosmobacter sp. HCP28S3_G4]|uniref:hypothetical protein n=1 Tax=Dysosmobacter sp. HCP28S3_G4 TaxID=3438938 RepID=UPI003F89118E
MAIPSHFFGVSGRGWDYSSLSWHKSPLSPTSLSKYKQKSRGLQGFFCDRNSGKTAGFPQFFLIFHILKQMFESVFAGFHKNKKPSGTRYCAGRQFFRFCRYM